MKSLTQAAKPIGSKKS